MSNAPYPAMQFVTSAANENGWPKDDVPELILLGRSNVGKSTFINALAGRSDIARVSKTPGRTQLLNFFLLFPRLRLVDAPGYGYAKISKMQRESWQLMMDEYLSNRPNLRAALVCIDGRHEPSNDDREMLLYLREKNIAIGIVFTKVDTLPFGQRKSFLMNYEPMLPMISSIPAIFSSSVDNPQWSEDVTQSLKRLVWNK